MAPAIDTAAIGRVSGLAAAARCAGWLVICACLPALAAQADSSRELRVEVVREHGVFHVNAVFPAAADAATAWAVLTDYDHLAEFVPDLEASRVVSAAGEPLRVAQRGRAGFAFLHFDIDVVLTVDATPMERLRFQEAGGSLRQMRGEWRIVPLAAGVAVHYTAQIEPGFWVPPLIGTALVRRDVRRQLAALAAEMHKRHALVAVSPASVPAGPDR